MAPPPVPLMLPYFRDPAELPGPLPTAEEIRNAEKSKLSPRRYTHGKDHGVCIIRNIYVVKCDINLKENEGNALLFIEKHLNIPAPRLYAMYRSPPSGLLHIVMEYIPGVHLESLWSSISDDAKSSIAAQLQPMFTQIQSLAPPNAFIGGVCGGKIPDPLFETADPDSKINGPFRTEEEVGLAFACASQSIAEQNGRRGWMSDFFLRHLPVALKGYGTKFTHGDLCLRNILVDKVPITANSNPPGVQTEENGQSCSYQVTGLVDWESAGWYPAYWEYVAAFARFRWDSDWLEAVDTIIKPYPLEASMFLLVLRDLHFI